MTDFRPLYLLALCFTLLGCEKTPLVTPYTFTGLELFPEMPKTSNPPTREGVKLGRFLFYDSILSLDYSMSCGSCHKQKYAFSDAPNRFSKGFQGKVLNRNTMPLFNLAWYPNFFWDGRAGSIEEQVFHPVRAHDEMNLDWETATQRIQESKFYKSQFKKVFGDVSIDSNLIAKAIGQFERILISNNSKYDQVLRGEVYFTQDEYEGFILINDQNKGDCLHCHTTDANILGTSTKFSNNGLDNTKNPDDYLDLGRAGITKKKEDFGWFKTPSLRNIAVTGPYMHDGRFKTLKEVLDFYSEGVQQSYNIDSKMQFAHQGGVKLSKEEKRKIIAYLHTLTDSVFLSNPEFSNPFEIPGNDKSP
jgi:cytochrome c peroxidase